MHDKATVGSRFDWSVVRYTRSTSPLPLKRLDYWHTSLVFVTVSFEVSECRASSYGLLRLRGYRDQSRPPSSNMIRTDFQPPPTLLPQYVRVCSRQRAITDECLMLMLIQTTKPSSSSGRKRVERKLVGREFVLLAVCCAGGVHSYRNCCSSKVVHTAITSSVDTPYYDFSIICTLILNKIM